MTATFSSLPNEVILQIWSHVLEPEDVESFALVSEKIYALAFRFIEEHKRLKAEYSIFFHDKTMRGSCAAEFLANILRNPRAALYVKNICINEWRDEWDSSATVAFKAASDCHSQYSEDTMRLIEGAVKSSVLIPESEITAWLSEIRLGDEGSVLALIISLIPNVRRFGLDFANDKGERLSQIIRAIGKSPGTTALSRLMYVQVGWDGTEWIDIELDWVKTFSSLKSVKAIKAWGVGQLHQKSESSFFLPSKWSNITSLQLHDCDIDHKHFAAYLQCLGALQIFSYTASPTNSHFDPFWLCTALGHAAHSLRKLHILSSGGTGRHMGSLARFTVLTELHTEYRMLLDDATELDGDKLIQMLPPSIEKVTLSHNDRYEVQSLENQITGLCRLKTTAGQRGYMLCHRLQQQTFSLHVLCRDFHGGESV